MNDDEAGRLEREWVRDRRLDRIREVHFWGSLLLYGGGAIVGGMHWDESTRNPVAFVALCAMVAGFLGLLFRR